MWQDHLCRVRFELLEGEGDERKRLRRAAEEFDAAYPLRTKWPPELRRRAEMLHSKLFAGRSPAIVDSLDENRLREISDDLWQFSEIAEPCPWDSAAAKVRGIEHLREARTALHGQQGDLRDRVRAATHSFRAAVLHVESWPEALRSAAEALTARLSRYGSDSRSDEPVRRMGNRTAGEISQEILRLCDDADRHQDECEEEQAETKRDHSC